MKKIDPLDQLRFPIGNFSPPEHSNEQDLKQWIADIESFPTRLLTEMGNCSTKQLNFRYRPDGWTVKQVVHHCADSHMSCIKRFKLALTEEAPSIRPYPEHLFAELVDSQEDDISHSMAIIKAVHHKLTQLLNNMSPKDFEKTYVHPEYQKIFPLTEATALYAWHGNHHLGHIKNAMESEGKYNKAE